MNGFRLLRASSCCTLDLGLVDSTGVGNQSGAGVKFMRQ